MNGRDELRLPPGIEEALGLARAGATSTAFKAIPSAADGDMHCGSYPDRPDEYRIEPGEVNPSINANPRQAMPARGVKHAGNRERSGAAGSGFGRGLRSIGRLGRSKHVRRHKELRALPVALKNANLKESTQHAILLILGTAVRVGEVIRAKKSHISLDTRTWTIPGSNSKNSDAHTVHLSDFAAHHLRRMMELSDSDEWLLPARKRDGTETHVDQKSISKQIGDRQLKFFERPAHAKRSVKFANALVQDSDGREGRDSLSRRPGRRSGERRYSGASGRRL